MGEGPAVPPRIARWLVSRVVSVDQRPAVEADLGELFARHLARGGARAARRWYWRQALGFVVRRRRFRPDAARTQDLRGSWSVDLRLAWRSLRRRPAFASLALVTLAAGIAANATAFSVLDGALFRPLPFPGADRIVDVRLAGGSSTMATFEQFRAWEAADLSSADLLAASISRYHHAVGLDSGGDEIIVQQVTQGFVALTSMRTQLGRPLEPSDFLADAPSVVVLSDEVWRRQMGGATDVIGDVLVLNGLPHVVVGVLETGFRFDALVERAYAPLGGPTPPPADRIVDVYVRLSPGETPEVLASELGAILLSSARGAATATVRPRPLREALYGWAGERYGPFMGVTALVLLIIAANLASLWLVRSIDRRRELALCAALGAGARRLARFAVLEVAVLTVGALTMSVVLIYWANRALLAVNPLNVDRMAPQVDLRVLGFAVAAAVVAGLVTALGPAWVAARSRAGDVLHQATSRTTDGPSHRWIRRSLVVLQVACSLLLLVGAGLLLRTLGLMAAYDPGFETRNMHSVYTTVPEGLYDAPEARRVVTDAIVDRLHATPGVVAVGVLGGGVRLGGRLTPTTGGVTLFGEDERLPPGAYGERGVASRVGGDYFESLGLSVLHGRDFDEADDRGANGPVAIVNEVAAARWWNLPAAQVVGRRFKLGPPASDAPWLTVIGVAPAYGTPYAQAILWERPPRVFLPLERGLDDWPDYNIRVAGPGAMDAIRGAVAAVDPAIMVRSLGDAAETLEFEVNHYAVNAKVLAGFALFGLVVSAMGLFAVVARDVSSRTREIGVRRALGASGVAIARSVAAEALSLSAVGLAVGLLLSFWLTRGLSSMLYGVDPVNPAVLSLSCFTLAGVAMVAAWLPARRALRVDPATALRE